jgi:hypothetical protein
MDPKLLEDLNALVEPNARGDPMSPLRWTCKSLRRLAAELKSKRHEDTLACLICSGGYASRLNRVGIQN